ncbi:MAG: 2-oxoglutarate dehydrogenase complex dihydrolipoyllysine-residue succinyltransferase [Opitutales bacterium]|nr:2-oxoglutarate dehydrogenase complex dihydrolipoyllysine-residue succinyltransferase [Opitutales bacterium]
MQHEVKVPSMGESITSGFLTQWTVSNGDYVNVGDKLYELETDKITSEGLAEVAGTIEFLVEADTEVEIDQVVAKIDDEGAAPAAEEEAEEPVSEAISDSDTIHPPSVERIAAETGIDPDAVEGTGKDGRVTKGDMLAAAGQGQEEEPVPQQEPAPVVEPATPASEPKVSIAKSTPVADLSERTTRKRMTPIRKKIAERLVQAQSEAAILSTFNEVDMSAVMKLRKELQEEFVATHGIKLGFMSFFVKAAVEALKAVPGINAQIEGDEVVTNHFYDIGVAVGTDRGLVVPVIRNCDQLTFAEIEEQLVAYGKAAKEGKIAVEDLQNGIFTISNGGVYGSLLSTPIINPPQSGILGMHAIKERPVAENGEVVIRPMMYTALSYDHRIVDGKEAVTFLVHLKKSIENPSRLLFGI